MYEEFNGLDREVQSRLLCEGLGDVDGSERGVEGEVEAVFVACLAVGQSRELLAVSVEELDLEARSVNRVDLLPVEGEVCREEDLAGLCLLEVLSKAALARVAIPRHLAEVDASGYGKEANHGLDEELFEGFV